MGSVLAAAAFVYRALHLTSTPGWSLTYREPRLSQGIPLEDFDNHALYSLRNVSGIPLFAGFSGTVPFSMLCFSQYKVLLNSPLSHKWLLLAQGLARGGVWSDCAQNLQYVKFLSQKQVNKLCWKQQIQMQWYSPKLLFWGEKNAGG